MRDKIIQLIAAFLLIICMIGAGSLLNPILDESDKSRLRYTNVSVEGAPPIVALGTAIGALRGLIVDYLWIKVNMMKQKGLFYEVMADADLITKLQPRFGQVWSFHGHNMAYNVSVMTDTPEERWAWVNAGIDLVRNKGLRHNPNDLQLYKELAFWFSHKLDGYSDDAHFHYKREFAKEWHLLLGAPPYDYQQRLLWMKSIAEAPNSLAKLEQDDPRVKVIIEELTEGLKGFDKQYQFDLSKDFLTNVGMWGSSKTSMFAKALDLESAFKANDPIYQTLEQVLGNPENQDAIRELLNFIRKKVLLEDYNMDPRLMYEYMRDTGPIDWRHPQAHALYWSRKGSQFGDDRNQDQEDGIYKVINNDRHLIHAMQSLARTGSMNVDPFSNDNPGRLSDNRWIDVLEKYFMELYDKHYKSRGAGGDTFTNFHENFMTRAVCNLFRSGETERAKEILARLDELYGTGGVIPSLQYAVPLDVFVQEKTYDAYIDEPWTAYNDVQSVLVRGFREGLLFNRTEVLEEALKFARDLTLYFKTSDHDYVNKFGEGRMSDLVSDLDKSIMDVFLLVLLDTSMPIVDRLTIFNRAPIEQQMLVYDQALPVLQAEFDASPLSSKINFVSIFPEPEGMQEFRILQSERNEQKLEERNRNESAERQ